MQLAATKDVLSSGILKTVGGFNYQCCHASAVSFDLGCFCQACVHMMFSDPSGCVDDDPLLWWHNESPEVSCHISGWDFPVCTAFNKTCKPLTSYLCTLCCHWLRGTDGGIKREDKAGKTGPDGHDAGCTMSYCLIQIKKHGFLIWDSTLINMKLHLAAS